MDKLTKLRIQYGALTGLLNVLVTDGNYTVSPIFLNDYHVIFENIKSCLEIDIDYLAPDQIGRKGSGGIKVDHFKAKVMQLKNILEHGFNVNDKIVQIGSLFNSIKDEQLRSRCADLLSANDHFDRVINQATLVLEDRIKKKSGSDKSGKLLINQVVKPDLATTTLILSSNANEQEGYANILRGVMQTLRNDTHHMARTIYSREDAFAVCDISTNSYVL